MSPPSRKPGRIRSLVMTLGLGALGGALFHLLDLPLAWMLGAMLLTTVASMAGFRLAMPKVLRDPMVAVLGVLLGSGFDLELLVAARGWLPTIAVLPFYVVFVGGVGFLYLRHVTGLDVRTAFFSATPGGFGEMIVMGEQAGGDVRRIALMHSTRVLLIVLMVPFLVRSLFFGNADLPMATTDTTAGVDVVELLVLLACAVIGYKAGQWAKLPGGTIVGPMILSAAAHIAGLAHGAPPFAVVAIAQLVIGAGIGTRFSGFPLRDVLVTLRAGLGLVLTLFAATFAVGAIAHTLTSASPIALFLALAPGGVAEMSLVALALGIEPAYVAIHHIIRIALVVMMAGPVFKRLERP
ncbi:MAG: AbrB family transcriptional regulator [Geminicoccaceae bacterium]|nr:AbrB family transcriptional regulator [Geminicoccaceae bacterium]